MPQDMPPKGGYEAVQYKVCVWWDFLSFFNFYFGFWDLISWGEGVRERRIGGRRGCGIGERGGWGENGLYGLVDGMLCGREGGGGECDECGYEHDFDFD